MTIPVPFSIMTFVRIAVIFTGAFALGCSSNPLRNSNSNASALPVDPAVNDRQVLSEYKSASGKTCRRFADASGKGLQVRCLTDKGNWQEAKLLNGIYSDSYVAFHLSLIHI